ncbi:MAG TPA: hypothetical protein VM286_04275 [Candidatus Thermoplasmatota archaeon]|nr:hypothetical protein [Candidatus Thermoplasmatota archaeon]
MRGLSILALLAVGALVLSGCSSKGGTSTSVSISGTLSAGKNTTKGGLGGLTNTSSVPNLPPIVKLTVTNTTGGPTNVTLVKGSLMFSAVGSHDADTDGLSAVAITAQDSNRTYPPQVLFAAGKFSTVTYTFDRPGPVNVTVSGIDVRGDLTTIKTQVFVNEVIKIDSGSFPAPFGSAPVYKTTDCKGAVEKGGAGTNPVDNGVIKNGPISLVKGAQWISAHMVSGKGKFAICSPPPESKAISDEGTESKDVVTTVPGPLPMPAKSTDNYRLFMLGTDAASTTPNPSFSVLVTVHYEPKPAAPAA